MAVMLLHFTRIPGCKKENSHSYKFSSQHYEYFGTFKMLPYGTEVIAIPCNNCNEHHKIISKNCELIPKSKHKVYGISFKKNSDTAIFFIENKTSLFSILNNNCIDFHSTVYNKESFFKTCANEDNPNSDPKISLWKKKHKFITYKLPPVIEITYLSLFCPVSEKNIKIICHHSQDIFRARYGTFWQPKELLISVKYGWNIFYICHYQYRINYKWIIYTTPVNEVLEILCNKPNFKMYILNAKNTPPSLLNLCFSNLNQHNLNAALASDDLPTTLYQQAPPCYFYHLRPFAVSTNKYTCHQCNTVLKHRSSHIADW